MISVVEPFMERNGGARCPDLSTKSTLTCTDVLGEHCVYDERRTRNASLTSPCQPGLLLGLVLPASTAVGSQFLELSEWSGLVKRRAVDDFRMPMTPGGVADFGNLAIFDMRDS